MQHEGERAEDTGGEQTPRSVRQCDAHRDRRRRWRCDVAAHFYEQRHPEQVECDVRCQRIERDRVDGERRRGEGKEQRPTCRGRLARPAPRQQRKQQQRGAGEQRIEQPRRAEQRKGREQQREPRPVSGDDRACCRVGGEEREEEPRRHDARQQVGRHVAAQLAGREDTRLEEWRVLVHRQRPRLVDEHRAGGERQHCTDRDGDCDALARHACRQRQPLRWHQPRHERREHHERQQQQRAVGLVAREEELEDLLPVRRQPRPLLERQQQRARGEQQGRHVEECERASRRPSSRRARRTMNDRRVDHGRSERWLFSRSRPGAVFRAGLGFSRHPSRGPAATAG